MLLPIPKANDATITEALSQWRRELNYFENVTLEQLNDLKSLIDVLQKSISNLKNGGVYNG